MTTHQRCIGRYANETWCGRAVETGLLVEWTFADATDATYDLVACESTPCPACVAALTKALHNGKETS